MNVVVKKNNELSIDELNFLYDIVFNDSKDILKDSNRAILTPEYKDVWIKETIDDDNLKCIVIGENGLFYGFAFLTIKDSEKENYLREVHIIKERQNDGITFKTLIKCIFENSTPGYKFKGKIFSSNKDAQETFKKLGAFNIKGYYQVKYDKIQKFLEENP